MWNSLWKWIIDVELIAVTPLLFLLFISFNKKSKSKELIQSWMNIGTRANQNDEVTQKSIDETDDKASKRVLSSHLSANLIGKSINKSINLFRTMAVFFSVDIDRY